MVFDCKSSFLIFKIVRNSSFKKKYKFNHNSLVVYIYGADSPDDFSVSIFSLIIFKLGRNLI